MSLLEQYESLNKGLLGFTLGFYKFFDSFTCVDHETGFSLYWNNVYFCSGTKIKQPNGIVMHFMTGYMPHFIATKVLEIMKFIQSQKDWIQSDDSQKEFKRNKRSFKEECQRRINFFIVAMNDVFSGLSVNGTSKTFDGYLRDIRHLGYLVLKD